MAGISVAVVRPTSWKEALAVGDSLTRWAFRGQSSADWMLSSSLERAALAADMPFDQLPNREWWMSVQFARRAHHYLAAPPAAGRLVEWLSLIQHHGGPTRLLDFTQSFYVSAFFALEFASSDSAVWAANVERIEDHADAALTVTRGPKSTLFHRYQQYVAAAEQFVADQAGPLFVLPVEPERLNERLSIQQGMFLMGCDLTRPFLENLAGSVGADPAAAPSLRDVAVKDLSIITAKDYALVKIVLPHSIRRAALGDLQKMNITAATLFPGLDGFARSLFGHVHTPLTA